MSRVPTPQHKTVAGLYQEHLSAPFPGRLRGADRAGIDMVMLDADTAGCVSTWLNNEGVLDTRRHNILFRCIADLDQVLPVLTEADDPHYWQRLRQVAQLVADA